jgi:hypothetical protein
MDDDRSIFTGDHSDLQKIPGSVTTDQHEQFIIEFFNMDRIVEGVENVVVPDPVLIGTLGDDWIALHINKIPCGGSGCKVPCYK